MSRAPDSEHVLRSRVGEIFELAGQLFISPPIDIGLSSENLLELLQLGYKWLGGVGIHVYKPHVLVVLLLGYWGVF